MMDASLSNKCGLIEAHGRGKPAEDFLVGQRLSVGLRRFRLGGYRVVEIGKDDVVEFQEAGSGQNVIGVDRRVGHEEVGHDGEQVFARKALADCFRAGT